MKTANILSKTKMFVAGRTFCGMAEEVKSMMKKASAITKDVVDKDGKLLLGTNKEANSEKLRDKNGAQCNRAVF